MILLIYNILIVIIALLLQISSVMTQSPTESPSSRPSSQPSIIPFSHPTSKPSCQPTSRPTQFPKSKPTSYPSSKPSGQPSLIPFSHPSSHPTNIPSNKPTSTPSSQPSSKPSCHPSSIPTNQPNAGPSSLPSSQPSFEPSSQPSGQPSRDPTAGPSILPSNSPSSKPSKCPTNQPSVQPSRQPLSFPSAKPTTQPMSKPSVKPSVIPTLQPSSHPTMKPTSRPSCTPTLKPTSQPTRQPSGQPSKQPTKRPSSRPTRIPTSQPTSRPSMQPFSKPTNQPTNRPSHRPTMRPTLQPASNPTSQPVAVPTMKPSRYPSIVPSRNPTDSTTTQPTCIPSNQPSRFPTSEPSGQPSSIPSTIPTNIPTHRPTRVPSHCPSSIPTRIPSTHPSIKPTSKPTAQPTSQPISNPSRRPSHRPSSQPSVIPTCQPTMQPSKSPSLQPTSKPSLHPSSQPRSFPTSLPTLQPSNRPTSQPTSHPSIQPTGHPTSVPTRKPTSQPSQRPTLHPTCQPSSQPTKRPTNAPTSHPVNVPTNKPSCHPTRKPSNFPTLNPTSQPSSQPSSFPSLQPSSRPSKHPSSQPSNFPTTQPTIFPSRIPSSKPSTQPTEKPTTQPSAQPTESPSRIPTTLPTSIPTCYPTCKPTGIPSNKPSMYPVSIPTSQPTIHPSIKPSSRPSKQPISFPTSKPSDIPSKQPISIPTTIPTKVPSSIPTSQPSIFPSTQPSRQPTKCPSNRPSIHPSNQPTSQPISKPTSFPTTQPTTRPSRQPTSHPSSIPSRFPTCQPSSLPTRTPSFIPTSLPTSQPSKVPTSEPTTQPISNPSSKPSRIPTRTPSCRPSSIPSSQPSSIPKSLPTSIPSNDPSSQPTVKPSRIPTNRPLSRPTNRPSKQPISLPTMHPSSQPTSQPSDFPTKFPSSRPSTKPSSQPSVIPSRIPTGIPTRRPVSSPTNRPTLVPKSHPTTQPSSYPTSQPSRQPTRIPSCSPTTIPTNLPTCTPTSIPTNQPSNHPSDSPSRIPTITPSAAPSNIPTSQPAFLPTSIPSSLPTSQPTTQPLSYPSSSPSKRPISKPSVIPTIRPTSDPTMKPSSQPSQMPTFSPTNAPSILPTSQPSIWPSSNPTSQPSRLPSMQPTIHPSSLPTSQPSLIPSLYPSIQPTSHPTNQPTTVPSSQPSFQPTKEPTSQPSNDPSSKPSSQPSIYPSSHPSSLPTSQPSSIPSLQPSSHPTSKPSSMPSAQPSMQPIASPSIRPSRIPTSQPSMKPTYQPSSVPSSIPHSFPSRRPSRSPSIVPSQAPSCVPIARPTLFPSSIPSNVPFAYPTSQPSLQPSAQPSKVPLNFPTGQPSTRPSSKPSVCPSIHPSMQPSCQPSERPSSLPSKSPSNRPTIVPSSQPSSKPSLQPNSKPTSKPSSYPSSQPTNHPTSQPSARPSTKPSRIPSSFPTYQPTSQPTFVPSTQPTVRPSRQPTLFPTCQPSRIPSAQPTRKPSAQPILKPTSDPTDQPTLRPTKRPLSLPSSIPSAKPSSFPTSIPSSQPSKSPTSQPSQQPTGCPSSQPSTLPSFQPLSDPTSIPASHPSSQPIGKPSSEPSSQPSCIPSTEPTAIPSLHPSSQPTIQPTSNPSSQPSTHPTCQPSSNPTRKPSSTPTIQPSNQPSMIPSSQPTLIPTIKPSPQPTSAPSSIPTRTPSMQPTSEPSSQPTSSPTSEPSSQPSNFPSRNPTNAPSGHPTISPTSRPTAEPSGQPTDQPTSQPSVLPTSIPTQQPSCFPSVQPTSQPSLKPSIRPSWHPTSQPSVFPSRKPSIHPTTQPTGFPSCFPTNIPTRSPSREPSSQPSLSPNCVPTCKPSWNPSMVPTINPTMQPTSQPTISPSSSPSGEPTSIPSSQPSCIPSAKPSTKPTSIPTHVPSKQPISSPSIVPTSQPSTFPSLQPFSKPSIYPSTQPTHYPTKMPSRRPTLFPSSQPSSQPSSFPTQPSSIPSSQPSSIPSDQPSLVPSSRPSSQPFSYPTSIPSAQPILYPTSIPTDIPTLHPSSKPTIKPSSQPTNFPTLHPSSQPSVFPTSVPSLSPTCHPSTQPSSQPSTNPSDKPTVRPTSSRPTSHPSSHPSYKPHTSVPTLKGMTNKPSEQPSSNPTFDLNDYIYNPIYLQYEKKLQYFQNYRNSYTFSNFYYKGLTVDGTCPDWQIFTSELSSNNKLITFDAIEAVFQYYNYDLGQFRSFNATCNDATVLPTLIYNLNNGIPSVTKCMYNDWRVLNCNSNTILCLNCKNSCHESVICPGDEFSISSCATCSTHSISSSILTTHFQISIPFPKFTSGLLVDTGKLSARIHFNITIPGLVFCNAFTVSNNLISYSAIKFNGNFTTMNTSGIGSVDLNNLEPLTFYNFSCFTQGFDGSTMPLTDVILFSVSTTTKCCKKVILSTTYDTVFQYIQGNSRPELVYSLELIGRPLNLLQVTLQLTSISCDSYLPLSASYPLPYTSPSVFSFQKNSLSLASNFVVRSSSTGCLKLTAKLSPSSESYNNTILQYITVSNFRLPPVPPNLSNITFSNDGYNVIINFDSDTDNAVSKIGVRNTTNVFFCDSILYWSGVNFHSWRCQWLNPSKLLVSFISNNALPNIGDLIFIQSNVIKAACISGIDCTRIKYMPYSNSSIITPFYPIAPIISLFVPSVIAVCADSIALSFSSYLGNDARKWTSVNWDVKFSPSSSSNYTSSKNKILTFLNQNSYQISLSSSVILNIPISYFDYGISYTIIVSVENYFLQFGSSSASFQLGINPNIPTVSISYDNSGNSFYRSKSITFIANAITACSNISSGLNYIWKIYDSNLQYYPDLSSKAINNFLAIPPYMLNVSTSYYVESVASLFDPYAANVPKGFASVPFLIGRQGVIARITNGFSQVISVASSITLDASKCQDVDFPFATLMYSWSCSELYPNFGGPCPSSLRLTNTVLLSIPGGILLASHNYTFSVNVMSSIGGAVPSSSSAQIIVSILSSSLPQVSIATTNSIKFNPQDRLILTGYVSQVTKKTVVSWYSPEITNMYTGGYSLTPSIQYILNSSISQISISPKAFVPGITYSFYLTASFVSTSEGLKDQAMAMISLVANNPPRGGKLLVSPNSGKAINTTFNMNAIQWIDDIDDYPLQYLFSYYSTDINSRSFISLKTIDSVISSLLGQGTKQNYFSVTCVVEVYDVYNSFTSSSYPVIVKPLSTSNLLNLDINLNSSIATAISQNNFIAINQIIGSFTPTLNNVDCLRIPVSCQSFNRLPCNSIPNTCGSCIEGYTGSLGSSNTQCIKLSQINSLLSIGTSCSSDTQCISNHCNITCQAPMKTCPNNCNNKGVCKLFNSQNETVSTCSIYDSLCYAQCHCSNGYYGAYCGYSSSDVLLQMNMRSNMCQAMLLSTSLLNLYHIDIQSISNSIASIIGSDSQLISNIAVSNCTAALVTILSHYSSNIGYSIPSSVAISALNTLSQLSSVPMSSNMINSLVRIIPDTAVITNSINNMIIEGIRALSSTIQLSIAIGENYNILSNNIRLSNSLMSAASLHANTSTMIVPISPYENANNITSGKVSLRLPSSSNANILGVSLYSFINLPFGNLTSATPIYFQTSSISHQKETNIRRLSSSLSMDLIEVSLSVANNPTMNYLDIPLEYRSVYCLHDSPVTYPMNITCPDQSVVNVTCPANAKGYFNITCSSHHAVPICTRYDFSTASYSPSLSCDITSFNSYKSQLIANQSLNSNGAIEYSTRVEIISSHINILFNSFESLDVAYPNTIVLASLFSIAILFALGILMFAIYDNIDNEFRKAKDSLIDMTQERVIEEYFHNLLPTIFIEGQWFELLWYRLMEEHYWFIILRPSFIQQFQRENNILSQTNKRKKNLSRTRAWLLAIGYFLIVCTIDVILAYVYFSDNGNCRKIINPSECLNQFTIAKLTQECSWNTNNLSCEFNTPKLDVITIVIMIAIVCSLAEVLHKLYEYLMDRSFFTFDVTFQLKTSMIKPKSMKISPIDQENVESKDLEITIDHHQPTHVLSQYYNHKLNLDIIKQARKDEFFKYQSRIGTLLRAARIVKAYQRMDFLFPYEESLSFLQQLLKYDQQKANQRIELSRHVVNLEYRRLSNLRHVPKLNYSQVPTIHHLVNEITHVRRLSQYIRRELNAMRNDCDKEMFLMYTFLTYCFQSSDISLKLMKKYLIEDTYGYLPYTKTTMSYRLCSWIYPIIFIIVLIVMILIIYELSQLIGERAIELWLYVLVIDILFHEIILLPLHIFVSRILLINSLSKELSLVIDTIAIRGRLILMRTSGVLRHANDFIQHLNPACRTARIFPNLSISRFLLSINDDDLPIISNRFILILFFWLNYFPTFLWDSLLSISLTCITISIFIGFIIFGIKKSILASCLVFGGFILLLVLIQVIKILWQWRIASIQSKIENEKMFYSIGNKESRVVSKDEDDRLSTSSWNYPLEEKNNQLDLPFSYTSPSPLIIPFDQSSISQLSDENISISQSIRGPPIMSTNASIQGNMIQTESISEDSDMYLDNTISSLKRYKIRRNRIRKLPPFIPSSEGVDLENSFSSSISNVISSQDKTIRHQRRQVPNKEISRSRSSSPNKGPGASASSISMIDNENLYKDLGRFL